MLTHGCREAAAKALGRIERLEVAHAQMAANWQTAAAQALLLLRLGAELAVTRLDALLFHGEWTIDLQQEGIRNGSCLVGVPIVDYSCCRV